MKMGGKVSAAKKPNRNSSTVVPASSNGASKGYADAGDKDAAPTATTLTLVRRFDESDSGVGETGSLSAADETACSTPISEIGGVVDGDGKSNQDNTNRRRRISIRIDRSKSGRSGASKPAHTPAPPPPAVSKTPPTDVSLESLEDGAFEEELRIPEELPKGSVRVPICGRETLFHPPSSWEPATKRSKPPKAPKKRPVVERVFGFEGRSAGDAVASLTTGEVAFRAGMFVVILDPASREQRLYREHTARVTAVAVNLRGDVAASGQAASYAASEDRPDAGVIAVGRGVFRKRSAVSSSAVEGAPHVRIWNAASLKTLRVVGGADLFPASISLLEFSRLDAGARLVVVDGASVDVGLSLWDWRRNGNDALAKTKAASGVVSVSFASNDKEIFVAESRGVSSWRINDAGAELETLSDLPLSDGVVSFAVDVESDAVISGFETGVILRWKRDGDVISFTGAHNGAVNAISCLGEGRFVSGGADRRMVLWRVDNIEKHFEKLSEISLPHAVGAPRCIRRSPQNSSKLLIGTVCNRLMLGNNEEGYSLLQDGHIAAVNAAESLSDENLLLTGCGEGELILWDTLERASLWREQLEAGVTRVAFHPGRRFRWDGVWWEGRTAAVGLANGHVIIGKCLRDSFVRQLDLVYFDLDLRGAVRCLRFSPDGALLAIGGDDNFGGVLHVFGTTDGAVRETSYETSWRRRGHGRLVVAVDWSRDSVFLRSNDVNGELTFWRRKARTGGGSGDGGVGDVFQLMTPAGETAGETATATRDVEWATHSCPVNFAVSGIWRDDSNLAEAASIAAASESLAVGGRDGRLRLYAFPCHVKGAACHDVKCHDGRVTGVTFSGRGDDGVGDDEAIVTTAGADGVALQWLVK